MTTEEAKQQVKDLIDRLDASVVNLHAKAPDISRERERDVKALKMLFEEGIGIDSTECPLCGV